MNRVDKLGVFLREVSNWDWEQFVQAEHDESYTSNEAVIFALVRACAMQKMDAIKIAISRLDGKLKTPVQVEYPKIYYLYPNAGLPAGDTDVPTKLPAPEISDAQEPPEVLTGEIMMPVEPEPEPEIDLPSMGIRETLKVMADQPRQLPEAIVQLALQTEQALRNQAPRPDEIPRVKSVMAAHLLILAQKRNIDALYEVFDQIDGKLVETIQVLGEDMYITDFSTVAPPDAKPNKDGILMVEGKATQDLWAQKLGKEQS